MELMLLDSGLIGIDFNLNLGCVMCKKDDRINELETELEKSHKREADLFNTLAEGYKFKAEIKNYESQVQWRPWQVALIPVLIAISSGLVSIAIVLAK